ncbi:MAG: hypothetical protein FWD11_11095, partial [Micrococcales bacterium]|nr:hypothetical protein [Micrococcales bacterium]
PSGRREARASRLAADNDAVDRDGLAIAGPRHGSGLRSVIIGGLAGAAVFAVMVTLWWGMMR